MDKVSSNWSIEAYLEEEYRGANTELQLPQEYRNLEGPESGKCIYGPAQSVKADQAELYVMPKDNILLLYLDTEADRPRDRDQDLFEYAASIAQNLDQERIDSWAERVTANESDKADYAPLD